MGARVQEIPDATPVALELEKVVKYREKENAGIDTLAGVAKLMQDYANKETAKKKQTTAKQIAKTLNDMATKMWSDYTAGTKKMKDLSKEIRKLKP